MNISEYALRYFRIETWAPQEPGDPGAKNPEESKEFCSKHALADEGF
jgi:hypothetical protein